MKKKEDATVIRSIAELHRFYRCGSARHPLVSVLDLQTIDHTLFAPHVPLQMNLYIVACKRFAGQIVYGRSNYDFDEGTMMFTAPNQVVSPAGDIDLKEGWALFFHPDLLRGTDLEKKMHRYSFFRYEANEALHISEEEKVTLHDCISNINKEYALPADKHSQDLIVSNIELLLNYCNRFYDRQFFSRKPAGNDVVIRFERLLVEYFADTHRAQEGLPDVKYFSDQLRLSPNYLSDLLSKYTGKTTQEHIHLQLVEQAKSLLLNTDKSISEVAYDLGFEHPSHFTKIFKAKTGVSPKDFRKAS
jgi:AraC family transcriptional regulator, transcriptional activator of pobA